MFRCSFILHIFIYLFPLNLAGGRRGGITLVDVLTFATESDDEPVLGYEINPSIYFALAVEGIFFFTANVCINLLTLERVDDIAQKFPDNLFTIFDYAFANAYYGNI